MRTIEYRTVDKSTWGEGEWQHEPDKKQWMDPDTGYPCLIVRNRYGALCGYVGISPTHPLYHKSYHEPNVNVHGGLTFADTCQPNADESRDICHKTDGDDHVWWFGFDCAHSCDYQPGNEILRKWDSSNSYRNFIYVQEQVESLASQLKLCEFVPHHRTVNTNRN